MFYKEPCIDPLLQEGFALKQSGLCMKHSGLCMKHSGLCMKHSDLPLKQSGFSLKQSDLYVKLAPRALKSGPKKDHFLACFLPISGLGYRLLGTKRFGVLAQKGLKRGVSLWLPYTIYTVFFKGLEGLIRRSKRL